MHEECISAGLASVLGSIISSGILPKYHFYMGGGTALALQLGHRLSEDLDFFSAENFEPMPVMNALATLNPTVQNIEEGTLHIDIQGQKVSFLHYPYALLYPQVDFHGCFLADYRDIAAMKVIATVQRGSKKDFADLNFILKEGMTAESLRSMLNAKYTGVRICWPLVVKGLAYFDDAELEAMPMMNASGEAVRPLTESDWQKIKDELTALQIDLLQQIKNG